MKRKAIKKAIRIVMVALLILLLLPIVVAGLLLIPAVQNQVVDWAAEYASDYTGSEITIDAIYLEPFSTVRLDELLVRDVFGDTLLYSHRFYVELNNFNTETGEVSLDRVELQDGYFNLYRAEGDSLTNLSHLLAVFQSNDTATTEPALIHCDEVVLNGIRFRFDDRNTDRNHEKVDFQHLYISGLSGRLEDVVVLGDSVESTLSGLHFEEQSGFQLRHLSTHAQISSRGVSLFELQLVANSSIVEGSYRMHTVGWSDYGDFIEQVKLEAHLRESQIRFDDISFFAPELRGMLTPLKFTGSVSGTIDNLRSKVDSLRFADSGLLKGRVKVKGLPDTKSLFIHAELENLYATTADVEQINIPRDMGFQRLKLPEQVKRAQFLQFQGEYVGFLNDFVAFGTARTAMGSLDADINLKSGSGILEYSGQLATKSFQLGKMIGASGSVQNVAFDLDVKGKGVELKSMEIEARGTVSSLGVLGYNYTNISIDGLLSKQVFEGNVTVRDTNVAMDFKGRVDLNTEIPQITCYTKLDHLRLGPLNLVPTDTFGVFSGELELDMKGNSQQTLHGDVVLRYPRYENQAQIIQLDSIMLSDSLHGAIHDITLKTDILNAHVNGSTNLFVLPDALLKVAQHYTPRLFEDVSFEGKDTVQYFDYSIEVLENDAFLELLVPELTLRGPVLVSGSLNTVGNMFRLQTDTVSWQFNNLRFDGNSVIVEPKDGDLLLRNSVRRFSISKNYFLESLEQESQLRNDSLITDLSWSNSTEQADSGALNFTLYGSEAFTYNAILNKLAIRIAGTDWRSEKVAVLRADTNEVMISNLRLVSSNGHITCNGHLESGSSSELQFDVKEFDLTYLSNFGLSEKKIEGIFNGRIDMHQQHGSLVANTNLQVDSLSIDNFDIGSISGSSRYDNNQQALSLNLDLSYLGDRNVRVIGDYYPLRETDQLDLEASLDDFRVAVLEPFIGQFVSNLKGQVNGSVSIQGMLKAPELSGGMNLQDFEAKVQYLNTTYRIPEGQIKVYPDLIAIDGVAVYDEKDSRAIATASVFHTNFAELSYDIFLDANDFLALNTTLAENESYYGRANISGDIGISGYSGHTLIDVVATTDKDTRLSIPLTGSQDVGELDYIRFVPPAGAHVTKKEEEEFASEIAGLELNFRLTVTDDAELEIIFDEKIGDVIAVSGNGDMLMQIDNKGNFNMYGDYVISQGDYLFTLQNIVNKRFEIEPGSQLVWNGAPGAAKVDLRANYKLRASPANLVYPDSSAVYRQRMPVSVFLAMKGALMEPTISFDVDLPSLPASDLANQLLDPATTPEQELNKQAFALLLTSNFMQSGGNFALGGVGTSTTYEMLSNQLSNWLSQYSDKFDLGVNLSKGDGTNTADEGEVSISTDIWNDRVSVELNGKVRGDNPNADETQNLVGEFNIEYRINEDGSLRARVYNESNNYNAVNLNQSPYTQGAAVFYQKEFNTWKEFFTRDKSKRENRKKRKEQRKKERQEAKVEDE